MPVAQNGEPTFRKPLRLWPGVAAAVLLLFAELLKEFPEQVRKTPVKKRRPL
jgi:hypothetical protein